MDKNIINAATANDTARNVFEEFSSRQRFHQETDLRALKSSMLAHGKKVNADEFMNLFSKLQQYGVGSIISGRGNRPTRFKWHYNLREVTKAAVSQKIISANKTSGGKVADKPKLPELPKQLVLPLDKMAPKDVQALIELIQQATK